jgi:hypothetical protein
LRLRDEEDKPYWVEVPEKQKQALMDADKRIREAWRTFRGDLKQAAAKEGITDEQVLQTIASGFDRKYGLKEPEEDKKKKDSPPPLPLEPLLSPRLPPIPSLPMDGTERDI